MINMISGSTQCDIKVGQNGVVVITGPPEGVPKATTAIRMVDQEAHVADLGSKVEQFLGGAKVEG